jgi:hypothetical protein
MSVAENLIKSPIVDYYQMVKWCTEIGSFTPNIKGRILLLPLHVS